MNSWAGLPAPTPANQVGGHEGVGKVVKLGPGAEAGTVKVGDRVGIKWIAATCDSCGSWTPLGVLLTTCSDIMNCQVRLACRATMASALNKRSAGTILPERSNNTSSPLLVT